MLPAIRQDREIAGNLKFSIPTTDENKVLAEQFRKTIEQGEGEVTLPGKFITSFRMSRWLERLYGHRDEIVEIKITAPKPTGTLDLELYAAAGTRTAVMPLRLKEVSGGTREKVFALDEPGAPVRMTFTVVFSKEGNDGS